MLSPQQSLIPTAASPKIPNPKLFQAIRRCLFFSTTKIPNPRLSLSLFSSKKYAVASSSSPTAAASPSQPPSLVPTFNHHRHLLLTTTTAISNTNRRLQRIASNGSRQIGSRLGSTRYFAAKDIRFGVHARALMLKGLDDFTDVVMVTMGPKNAFQNNIFHLDMIIKEMVRLANIAAAIFRKAMKDIKIKDGYTIPKGWGIMMCPPAIHMDPNIYKDPIAFDPWRWEEIDVNGGSKNFMAFGGGMRFCVGADFSKLQMFVFLHHLVTRYRWVVTKGGEIVRSPGLKFPNGLHIKLMERLDD